MPYIFQIRKVVDISGRVEVAFDNLGRDLGLSEDYSRQVVFDVRVKEEHTERIQVRPVLIGWELISLPWNANKSPF